MMGGVLLNNILFIFLEILLILICGLAFLVFIVYRKIFCRNKRTVQQEIDTLVSKGLIDEGYYDNLAMTRIMIKTKDNCQLAGYLAKCGNPMGCILLSHGISSSHAKLLGHVEFFKAHNYDVLLIDQRGYGNSSKSISTYGVKEKEDLLLWISRLRNIGYSKIGIFGHSMGASAALLTCKAAEGPDFIIAESGFSNFSALLKWQLSQNKLPYFAVAPILNIICRVFHGFALDRIDVISEIKDCKIPLLFIHGREDKLIPCVMSKAMSEATGSELYIVEGCGHSIYNNIHHSRYEYEKVLNDFLSK